MTKRLRRVATAMCGIVVAAATLVGAGGLGATPAAAQTSGGSPPTPATYWLVGQNGSVYSFGAAPFDGSAAGQASSTVVGMAGDPVAPGYWVATSTGGVFAFGSAQFFGSPFASHLQLAKPIVGIAATPDGGGYWLVASDGGIFAYGDANFYGSTGAIKLNKPIVTMASTPDGRGYWLAASDGGIFTFGDANFYGSTGAIKLNKPVLAMAPTADGRGYWLAASDGGIFTFGDADFHGSLGDVKLAQPIVGMTIPPGGGGYWMVAADGGIFAFGSAPYRGSLGGEKLAAPIAGMAATHSADPYTGGSSGYDVSFPQCNGWDPFPSAPYGLGVIGVNDGASFRDNSASCLASELSWGQQAGALTVYMNINSPSVNDPGGDSGATGPAGTCAAGDSACYGYNYGYNAALDAFATATSAGISSPMWWLDVEGPAGSGNPLWSSDTATNDRVIQGAIDALTAKGVEPGVYSTPYQWGLIAGSTYQPDVPEWQAGLSDSSPSSLSAYCAKQFTAGPTWLVQWTETLSNGTAVDHDYACTPS